MRARALLLALLLAAAAPALALRAACPHTVRSAAPRTRELLAQDTWTPAGQSYYYNQQTGQTSWEFPRQ